MRKKTKDVPLFRTVIYLWFFSAMYSYGDTLYLFESFMWMKHYHHWICFGLYTICFMMSTLSFRQKHMQYQMGQLSWTLLTVGLVVFQMIRVSNNIRAGLFWYVYPCMLIFTNDSFAYFVGMPLSRKIVDRPFLPTLSKNKTWEGFIGGAIFTHIFAFFVPWVPYMLSEWMICPLTDPMATELHCEPNPVFVLEDFHIPASVDFLGLSVVTMYPLQLHSLCFAFYASIVAPFGGFFASAIKRAYSIKDFDSLIPGHGGILDRMDCQLLMALCVGAHYITFIKPDGTVSSLIESIGALPVNQRDELLGLIAVKFGSG